MKPILSIIIISYNTKTITQDCIESIYRSFEGSTIPFEIIVIDNVSTDGSIEMLEDIAQKNTHLRLIKNNENVGFARANNQGAAKSTGDYLLLLNSDIVVIKDAIPSLVNFFQQNEKNIHFLGGKLLNKDLTPQASCGPSYSLPVVFAALFLRGDYWGLTRNSPNTIKEVDWISGACILTTKKIYDSVGGFDEKIFMYMDEIDLLYRAKKKHYHVFFYPYAQFIHLGSASSGNRTYPILQVFKGLLYFYRKHHSAFSMFLLKRMLELKSLVAIILGKITKNTYMIHTYEEALKLIAVD